MKLGVAAGLFVWVTLQPWIITAQEPLTGRPVRVALIGFQPEVADLSVAELSKDSELLLVERAELERILGELALSSSQNLKPADALRLGKMLGADWLLLGQILSLQGTNHLLARIADARTGIIRDLAMFPATPSNYLASAKAVADFLRSSRRAVTNLSERQFVALGAFTDLSVSKRYRDFGDQFRAWLTERFRTSSVAVVERSATEMLLTELRMSQAGFSEPRTNYTEAMPAVLIADGIYQSFQDTNSKLNIVLRLQRMGERARTIAFNEPPGPALNGKLAGAIEKALAESGTVATNIRAAEVAEQIRRGRELAGIVRPEQPRVNLSVPFEPLREKRSKELLPAIEAFRAALFLDPDNSDAKYLLALCLIDVFVDQKEEARNLFREVVAGTTNAAFVKAARDCIADSYLGEDDEHAFELFSALYKETGSQFYSDRMAGIRRELLKAGKLPWEKQIELHNESWRAKCQAEQIKADAKETVDFSGAFIMPIHEYSAIMAALPQRECYRRREAYVAELLPQLKAEFPTFTHHFTLGYFDAFGALRYNKPPTWLVQDFDEMLSWCEVHGGEITSPASFYPVLAGKIATFVGRTNMTMALRVASIVNKHGRANLTRNDVDKNNLLEGFAHRELGNWAEAASAFQRVGDREIRLPGDGPWGKNPVINAAVYAKECQRRATGEAAPEIPTFQLGKPLFTLNEPVTGGDSEGHPINPTNLMMRHANIFATLVYACDGPDIWAAHGRTLHRYNLNSGTLEPVSLSVTNGSIIKTLAVDKGRVWIGTRTNGLIVLDSATAVCRSFTEADGLILPDVSAILPAKDRVWLGFAVDGLLGGGGIGYLERSTDRFVGFSSELKPEKWDSKPVAQIGNTVVRGRPSVTRMPIYEIRDGASNTLVLSGGSSIWRFSSEDKKWQQLYSEGSMSSMDSNLEYIVAGSTEPQYWTGDNPRFGGVAICRIADGKWQVISRKEGLPNGHIRSVALDGNKLWVGGRDFIALIELPSMRIARMATGLPNNESARSFRVHEGRVFAKVGSAVYRLPSTF